MAVRLPLTTVIDFNDAGDVGAGSVAGGVAKTFYIPQDTDNIVVKFTASTIGGAVSAVFQTTDDGGVTFYDVARTSVVSNANNTTAEWLSIPVVGVGVTAGRPVTGSVLSTTGSAAASTLGSAQFSGLPILSPLNRVFFRYTGNLTGNDLARVQVKVNNQSATS
jgi:hypothetical protein